MSIPDNCGKDAYSLHIIVKFGYSFSNKEPHIGETKCKNNTRPGTGEPIKLPSSLKSSSEFFVFVGVISFLYCIVAMVYYVCFEDPAKYGPGGTGRDIKSFATVVRHINIQFS